MGRVWMAFFVLPYPNTSRTIMGELQLTIVVGRICVSTYFTVSLLFWYSGLIA
jgi:molybdopterin-containing oxidoreductase family membrane subunit